jgi:hypothetical protein
MICDDMFMLTFCIINLSLLLWSIYIACRFKVVAKSWLVSGSSQETGQPRAGTSIGNGHHV